MSQEIRPIDEIAKDLSPEQQRELRDFAEFLLTRRNERPRGKPGFQWAGALNDLRGHYNSVDLQHQISRWRTDGE